MSMLVRQLPDGPYEAAKTEEKILKFWLEQDLYAPETAKSKALAAKGGRAAISQQTYTIIDPPPNAYARPHLGNVSGYAYQDLFGRRARMQGKETLLLPGKDHAAQQAEIVYSRDVLEPQGKRKKDFTREDFYQQAYRYFTGIMEIAQQDEKRIGLSADFNRDLFTLDPRVAATIYRTFAQMWHDGMVYKGVRIVNWSPGLNSAVADIDTERETVDSTMYYLKYRLPEIDQGILNLREQLQSQPQLQIKVVEPIEIDNQQLKKLNKQANMHHFNGEVELGGRIRKLGFWIDQYINPGDNIDARAWSIVVPVKGEASIVLQTQVQETAAKQYEYVFKAANHLYGSAFVQELSAEAEDKDFSRAFIVGTVRPETKFGDTALAVHPEDERFTDLIGQDVEVESLNGKVTLRIITDTTIDREFGTGMMKLTPAHAPTDYDIYLRHNQEHPERPIDYKNVIEKDGRLNHLTGQAEGMHAEKDREKIANLFAEAGFVAYEEPSESNVIMCERTKTIIQPIMSSQWFIDTDKLKVPALEAVRAGKVNIHPDYMTKKLEAWLENLRDWPISRSIWWGYRIPVWYKGQVSEKTDANGHLQVEIGGQVVADMQDARDKGLMKLDLGEGFAPVLVPGKYGFASPTFYADIKKKYPWAQIVDVHNAQDPGFANYRAALDKINFTEKSVVVAHSLGNPAILGYLSEKGLKVDSLILIAPSTLHSKKVEHYKQKGFWGFDLAKASQVADRIHVIYSDDDEIEGPSGRIELAKELKAEIHQESGRKHFFGLDYTYSSETTVSLLDQQAKVFEENRQQELSKQGWLQDEDVFDTWFSSGQWPFATLEAEGLMRHYPTQVMETGFDILELWVSRMIMLGLYTQGEVPFEDVYLHGLINAEDGQKMSKSKGNIVNADEIIAEYGADTLRMFYIVGNKAGSNYRIDRRKFKGYRNFLNKLWNASRFVLQNLGEGASAESLADIKNRIAKLPQHDTKDIEKTLADFTQVAKKDLDTEFEKTGDSVEILQLKNMQKLIANVDDHFAGFRPGMAAEEIIQNFWQVFADIYIEQVKSNLFLVDREGNPINRD